MERNEFAGTGVVQCQACLGWYPYGSSTDPKGPYGRPYGRMDLPVRLRARVSYGGGQHADMAELFQFIGAGRIGS